MKIEEAEIDGVRTMRNSKDKETNKANIRLINNSIPSHPWTWKIANNDNDRPPNRLKDLTTTTRP